MLTQEELKQTLTYNPDTGNFTWNSLRLNGVQPGAIAGSCQYDPNSGYPIYISIVFDYKQYKAHQLAWLYVYGDYVELLDHINGNPFDNRIVNLRTATYAENAWNRRIQSNSTTGVKGVSYVPNTINGRRHNSARYRARVTAQGTTYTKSFRIQDYPSEESALQAAQDWVQYTREQIHGEFARHN